MELPCGLQDPHQLAEHLLSLPSPLLSPGKLPLAGDELAALALTLLGSRQWKLASRSQPP